MTFSTLRNLGAGLASAMAIAAASCPLAVGLEDRPLKITKFSLQTTRTIETSGTRLALEEGKLTQQSVTFTHNGFGFETRPYSFTQADGHPDALTANVEFESESIGSQGPTPTRDPKDLIVTIPPGLLGDPVAVQRCPLKVALSGRQCPPGTQIGIAVVYLLHGEGRVAPIFNVTPEAGQSAEFAMETTDKIGFVLTGRVVRTPEGYGLTVVTNGIPRVEVSRAETTFWGVPADKSHDGERGLACSRQADAAASWACGTTLTDTREPYGFGEEPSEEPKVPFLTMPSDCTARPESAAVKADSWEEPGRYVEAKVEQPLPTVLEGPQTGVTGCNLLPFGPGIAVSPETVLAEAPTGLDVALTVPQVEQSQTPATPEMRKATLTFPLGMSVNPGIVDGVQACEATGPEGIDIPTGLNPKGEPLQPGELGEGEEFGLDGEPQLAAGHCPDASIIGTAKATTPLLSEPVEGHVYLAKPACGDLAAGQRACTEEDAADGNLYQLYLELGGKGALANTGVNIKVRLKADANPATGQLTSIAEEIAQLPFSKLEVKLKGGPRAALANPPLCGPAVTSADFTPWSAPGLTPEGLLMTGTPDATPSSFYEVSGCSSPPRLAPGFVAGTVIPTAGRFSPFTLNISRNDREEYIKGVQVHTPPGLGGILAGMPLCAEPAADRGECPEASKIGTTRVATGAGSHPFEIEGSVYLTESYRGAPFGLSIVTNAVAGPFNLGKVVVRARISVNPDDSTLTVTTDESGPHAIPQILFGVPLRLQRITANIDRPSFMFNPTNCAQKHVTAEISGSGDAVTAISSPFTAGDCRHLAFKPKFTVSASGRTSRSTGTSLDAVLVYPKGAMGNDANVAKVKVTLPRQLPSRLETLKKACPAQTFASNPASCPAGSIVGIARADTPLLPKTMSPCPHGFRRCAKEQPVSAIGPAYFVSFGGEGFPELIVVLEGDGVRVDLTGDTFISKGITTSTFNAVPDVPVERFELYLQQGRDSALTANGNLCRQAGRLTMPTEFVGQNGTVIHKKTKIEVTGCAKAKPTRKKTGKSGGRRRK